MFTLLGGQLKCFLHEVAFLDRYVAMGKAAGRTNCDTVAATDTDFLRVDDGTGVSALFHMNESGRTYGSTNPVLIARFMVHLE
jgi:hypothetical protein